MAKFETENLMVIMDDRSITLRDRRRPEVQVTLFAAEYIDVLSFLRSINPDRSERRTSFRVPVLHSEMLSVHLVAGATDLAVAPVNLSLTGILVRLAPDESAGLETGAETQVELAMGHRSGRLRGIVRRRTDDCLGIHFPESLGAEGLDPPDWLMCIYSDMQTDWLRGRVGAPDAQSIPGTPS